MSETSRPTDKPAENDLAGRKLGDYQLIRRLGRGGMAEVWLAEQCSLKRQVAVKILKSELSNDATYIQRFRVEAQAAARLTHANIIQIYDVGTVDGVHYIAQEYVQGQNLREYLVRQGPPELRQALRIIRQVAAALQKAAEQGIVHRDVKPENIMLSRSNEVKVADFGLARMTGDSLNLTQVGMTMGTPLYMSPEQVEGKPLDPRSDVYSFGVTAYHMLAGSPPFRGETALSVAVQHLKSRPEPLETLRPDLPPALCRIVHKMLAKDPAQRYASAREILRDLRSLQYGDDAEDAPEEFDELDSIPPEVARPTLSAATQRLGHTMAMEALAQPKGRPAWLSWTLFALLGLAIGGGLAALARDDDLISAPSGRTPAIAKQETARQQYFLAAQINNDEAWRSVNEYFPSSADSYYTQRAKQQIARLMLYRQDYANAARLFEEFASLPDSEKEFRAFGLAGRCVVLSLQEKYQKSAAALVEVWPSYGSLDPGMQRMVNDAKDRNIARLGDVESRAIRDLRPPAFDPNSIESDAGELK